MAYSRFHKRNVRATTEITRAELLQVIVFKIEIYLEPECSPLLFDAKWRAPLANNCQFANLLPLGAARIAIGNGKC